MKLIEDCGTLNQIGPLPLHTSGRGTGSYIYTLGTTKIQLRNECDINFWRDKWLDNEQLCHSFPNLYHNCGQQDKYVKKMFHRGILRIVTVQTGDFRIRKERRDLVNKITSVTLDENKDDKPKWLWDKNKKYTFASCYGVCTWRGRIDKFGKKFWKVKVLTKVHAFMSLAANNTILTWDNLQKREWSEPGICF